MAYGYLGTPRGTIEEYMPVPGHPGHGHTTVLNAAVTKAGKSTASA